MGATAFTLLTGQHVHEAATGNEQLVYSATRYDRWDMIVHEAIRWGVRMALFLGGIGVALYALSTLI